jgi:hypothetical protein
MQPTNIESWLAASNIVSSLLLLIVTAINVVLTHKISKANTVSAEAAQQSAELTKRTADSAERGVEMNLRMITEMREQRMSAVQPFVVGDIDNTVTHNGFAEIVSFTIRNVGAGPALNIAGSLCVGGVNYASQSEGFAYPIVVMPSQDSQISVQLTAPRDQLTALGSDQVHSGQLALRYNDIYGRQYDVAIPLTMNCTESSLSVSGSVEVKISD